MYMIYSLTQLMSFIPINRIHFFTCAIFLYVVFEIWQKVSGPPSSFLLYLLGLCAKVFSHFQMERIQRAIFNFMIINLTLGSCIIHMDFAENFKHMQNKMSQQVRIHFKVLQCIYNHLCTILHFILSSQIEHIYNYCSH